MENEEVPFKCSFNNKAVLLVFAFVLKIVLPICKKVKVNVEKMLVDNNLHMKM